MKLIKFLAVFLVLFSASATDKITFDVYIESMCKYSRRFVEFGLSPEVYNEVKDKIILRFFPCGKSSHSPGEDGKEVFECQHGELECVYIHKFQNISYAY